MSTQETSPNQSMRVSVKNRCACCNSNGVALYGEQGDRLFNTPGKWTIYKCSNARCELMWLNPMPVEEDLYLAYQNYYTHAFSTPKKSSLFLRIKSAHQALHFNHPTKESGSTAQLLSKLITRLNFFKESMDYPLIFFKDLPHGNLLELGVGSGETLKQFSDWGWQAEGLDFDPEAVKACALRGLQVRQGDLHSQKFASETFNAIFSAHVMEHVPQPIELIAEGFRILKPGGLFVAVTPNGKSALHSLFKKDWRGLEPPRHLHIFTKEALLSSAKQAGFSKVKVITSNFSAAGVFSASARLKTNCQNSFPLRLLSNLARLILTFYWRFYPDSGEELILIAEK
ncbi:bifunctional 2-polyprenyl-6-hydroxyphenol methylase/3-demethylubiquinol 3-O-methyltransferase UbiG [Polynucleobacter sp. Fuers-14]|uniref:class I SAM-dependent methyltransferase n=1 Tax=Polynucleobacter sp. Fuers-14 TaxID=1758364 RepID=UPI001C0E8232|nr:class I SAM-dependent methyltransferase [Polynucleobacter sp. Fuers-14]MBU3641084.1 class I SAM-dependent methyltransferase [Polynucleobacter sp. Fuers-14]